MVLTMWVVRSQSQTLTNAPQATVGNNNSATIRLTILAAHDIYSPILLFPHQLSTAERYFYAKITAFHHRRTPAEKYSTRQNRMHEQPNPPLIQRHLSYERRNVLT